MTVFDLHLPQPHAGQRAIIAQARRFNVLVCGRRYGKTILMADRLIRPLLQGYPVGWFAPTYKVLDDAWLYLKAILAPLIKTKDEADHFIELTTSGKIEFWSLDSGIVARSRKYKRVVVDEAAQEPNLLKRWQAEIRPTLVDFEGGAWFGSTPNGINDFYDFFLKGDGSDPEWMSWQKPSWDNPYLPLKERQEMRKKVEVDQDPVARQEYGAEFVSSEEGFVQPGWVDACALWGDHWQPLDRSTPICVGLDAASKSDTFAISGQGREPETRKYKTAFVKVFQPEELVNERGIITFARPKQFIKDIAHTYHVISFVYDPYQLISTAGELFEEGLALFEEFPQGTKRAMADQLLYELIRDQNWNYSGVEHELLAQHIKNANAKIEAGEKRRMVKRTDKLKIDAGVATSMSLMALQNYNV
jgi:hypothetical protein